MKKKIVFISYYGRINLGVLVLSSILKRAGHETYVFYLKEDRSVLIDRPRDNTQQFQFLSPTHGGGIFGTGVDVNPPTREERHLLAERIRQINPALVALSSRSVHLDMSRDIVNDLRAVLPEARFVAGGYGPSLEPEEFLKFCDYVCIGKGDNVIVDFVELEDPSGRPGVGSIRDGKVMVSPPIDNCDLNARPFLDWDSENKFIIDDGQIFPLDERFDVQCYMTIASEGCPSNCTYCQACQWPQIYRMHAGTARKVRMKDHKLVISELKHTMNKHDIKSVMFSDSIFTWNKKWLDNFLDIYRREIDLPFICYVDSRFTSISQMKKLKENGLYACSVGIQSADQRIRQEIMGRKESDEDLIQFANQVNDLGIKITYDIILWNPFETEQTLQNGIKLLERLPKSNRVIVYELKMLPHSTIKMLYDKYTPKAMSGAIFLYWAWIYVFILRSEAGQRLAQSFLSQQKYMDNPYSLREEYLKLIAASDNSEKLFAIRSISKGDTLRPTMFIEKPSKELGAVESERRHAITGYLAAKDIQAGQVLHYDDYTFSYAQK